MDHGNTQTTPSKPSEIPFQRAVPILHLSGSPTTSSNAQGAHTLHNGAPNPQQLDGTPSAHLSPSSPSSSGAPLSPPFSAHRYDTSPPFIVRRASRGLAAASLAATLNSSNEPPLNMSTSPPPSPHDNTSSTFDMRDLEEQNLEEGACSGTYTPRSISAHSTGAPASPTYSTASYHSPRSTSSLMMEEFPRSRPEASSAPSSLRIPTGNNSASMRRQSISSPSSGRSRPSISESDLRIGQHSPKGSFDASSLHHIWVNNLPSHWQESDIHSELQCLLDLHTKLGEAVKIVSVRKEFEATSESLHRTMATIGLSSREDCAIALQVLRHCKVQGKSLYITFHQPQPYLDNDDASPSANTLFVANVHPSVNEDQLKLLFMQFGEVVSATVVRNRHSNVSRGFVFIQFVEHASCELALHYMQNELFCGQQLKLKIAKAAPATTPSASPSPREVGLKHR